MTQISEFELRAKHLGMASCDAYWEEYDEAPRIGEVGEYDESAWAIAWHDLKDCGASDDERETCRIAWECGFFNL